MTLAAVLNEPCPDTEIHREHGANASRVVRGGGERLLKVIVAVMSSLVAALMLTAPLASATNIVYVIDREGDLGKTWYSNGQGSHLAGDPISWWSGNSPISNAGYLDILAGWVTVNDQQITMGMLVKDPVTVGTQLPTGVKLVRWVWYFFLEPAYGHADYCAIIIWDGGEFTAALKDQTGGAEPFPVTYLSSDSITHDITDEGYVLTLTVDSSAMPGVNWWYFVSCVFKNLWPLEGAARYGGWYFADRTDEPTDTLLPWWPMPS